MFGVAVSFDQAHFRYYADDGAINDATAIAAEDADITSDDLALDTNVRVRLVLSESGAGTIPVAADSLQLQYRVDEGTWTDVTASSSVCRATDSPNVADGATLTRLLSQSGANVFVDGTFDEVDGKCGVDADSPAYNGSTDIEVEYCVQFRSADLSPGEVVDLRLTRTNEGSSSPVESYSQTPSYTVAVAGSTESRAGALVVLDILASEPWD
jgi:hypothetical protein